MNQIKYIAIRRENKSVWERRVALTPIEVKNLLDQNPNLKIIIQPSNLRIFTDIEYQEAGALVQEDISKASVIIGVKEIPLEYLQPNKTYMYFSHTIKAQKQNMAALDHILQNNIRLIDYEKICDKEGKRLVAFGKYAGLAGMIDFLSGMGIFLFQRQIPTLFMNIDVSYKYFNLQEAFKDLKKVGDQLKTSQIDKEIFPLVFGITGMNGRVGQGAFEILQMFPYKIVTFQEIEQILQNKNDPMHLNQIYIVSIEQQHMVENKFKKNFDKNEYYSYPQNFKPIFHEKYLKYISIIVHCMYWDQKFPKLITDQQMKDLQISNQSRLLGVCDITCDFEGSIEFLKKFTDCDSPFYTYEPITSKITDGCNGQIQNGILYHSMDFLPCELGYDASSHFGQQLIQFIPNIAFSDFDQPLEQQGLCYEIQNAVITAHNNLTPNFQYIQLLRKAQQKEETQSHKLTRNKSFFSMMLQGKLFDSDAFQHLCLILKKYDVQFNFADWQFQNQLDTQQVCLQVISNQKKNKEFMNEIQQVLNEFDVEILNSDK